MSLASPIYSRRNVLTSEHVCAVCAQVFRTREALSYHLAKALPAGRNPNAPPGGFPVVNTNRV